MPKFEIRRGLLVLGLLLAALSVTPALADTDETTPGVNPSTVGMQPLRGAISPATPAPGESRLTRRSDGTFAAIAEVSGHTRVFHLVERDAPWTLQPGLSVL